MKKLMIAASAALCATVGFSDVTSANVVGYHNQDWMPASFVMMGGQFEGVDGSSIKLSQINFGENFDGPYYGDGPEDYIPTAPQVQVAFADREGNTKYYFVHDAIPVDPDAEETDYLPGWLDKFGDPADPDVLLGLGYWYCDAFNATRAVNNAGGVLLDSPWDKDFNRTFRMLVCPYPKAVKLSEITFVDIDNNATYYQGGPDDFIPTATQIQIPFANREGFTKYYYLADGIPLDDSDDPEFGPGWVDKFGDPVDADEIVIPAGRGCWFCPSPDYPKEKMKVIFSL